MKHINTLFHIVTAAGYISLLLGFKRLKDHTVSVALNYDSLNCSDSYVVYCLSVYVITS
jgi:hypothetical protein